MQLVKAITLKPGDIVMGSKENPSIMGTVSLVRHYPAQHARTEESGHHSTPANWASVEDVRTRGGISNKARTSILPPTGKTAAIITKESTDVYQEQTASVSIQIGHRSFSVRGSTEIKKVG